MSMTLVAFDFKGVPQETDMQSIQSRVKDGGKAKSQILAFSY